MSQVTTLERRQAEDHPWTGTTSPLQLAKLAQLFSIAYAWGLTVAVDPLRPARHGEFHLHGGLILLNEKLHAHQAVDALAHELTHAFHRDPTSTPEIEVRANRGAVALVLDEQEYLRRFDPTRHLNRAPNLSHRDLVTTFGCGTLVMKWRHALDPDCGFDWCPSHAPGRS